MKRSLILMAFLILAEIPLACGTNNSNPTNPYAIPTSTFTLSPTVTNTPSFTPTGSFTPTITGTPTNTFTPTATNTPVPVGVTFDVIGTFPSFHYAITGTMVSAPVTISLGTSAVWDSTNAVSHPLYLDNGTTSCLITGGLSFPATQVLGVGTYHFHCGNHGACTNNLVCPNANCTGMAVTLIVQ